MANKEEQFERLYQTYYSRLVSFLVRFGLSREDARETAQEAFLSVYRSMDRYRGDAEWGYLQTTARNLGLNRVRDALAKKRNPGPGATMEDAENAAAPPRGRVHDSSEQERRVQRGELRAAIQKLPESLRLPLLHRLNGFSYKEIQTLLGLSMDAVKSRLNEARNRLKERFGTNGDDDPEDEQ
jgi:RNA polymerase sigma-70 factor (ECF subfamily)